MEFKPNRTTRIVLTALFAPMLAAGITFCIPAVQQIIIQMASKVLGREFLAPQWWLREMIASAAVILISIAVAGLGILGSGRLAERYSTLYAKNKERNEKVACVCIMAVSILPFILPLIIFGEDSVITVWDNLDFNAPVSHYIHEHKLFWKIDEQLPVWNGISTLYFNREGYSVCNALLCLLPTYAGYVTNYVLCVFLGFFSMFFMQRIVFKGEDIILIMLTSLAYALLPSFVTYRMGVATLPFAVILFYKLLSTRQKRWLFLSFIYPFFSEFSGTGLFVCGFWLLALLAVSIKGRKPNVRLLLGLLLICVGFLIVIWRLVYMRLVIHEPLNRDFITTASVPFLKAFARIIFFGSPHSATLQSVIVNPTVLLVSAWMLLKHMKGGHRNWNYLVVAVCLSIILFCGIIIGLDGARIMGKIINVFLPFLSGLQFERVYIIAKLAWYVAFTACLLHLSENGRARHIAHALAVLQILFIFAIHPCAAFVLQTVSSINGYYNDSMPTLMRHIVLHEGQPTWREFYDEKLFSEIKESLGYSGENVCAFGYDPAVLLYNDFNTIGGYSSMYPHKDMLLWHDLMAPEFEHNEVHRDYFDSWGGRRYIYTDSRRTIVLDGEEHEVADFDVDMDILRNDYKCRYVLSSVEIANAEERGLSLKGIFDSEESIYRIFVYEL